MYVEAIKNGYTVSDEEVNNYVEELKRMLKGADNSGDVETIISKYPSEEDYWNYMREVYKKQLPIQKYVEALENDFNSRKQIKSDGLSKGNDFDSYFEKIKKDLAKNQSYTDEITSENLSKFIGD